MKTTLQKVWEILFGGLSLDPDEYIEVPYDKDGDKTFNRAFHVKSLEELEEKVQELSGKVNIAICPSIRKIKDSQKNKRTGGDCVSKQKTIILDIDSPEYHNNRALDEEEANYLFFKVFNKLPEDIKQAVVFVGYTGGGVQIYLSFEPLIGKANIEKAHKLLYEILKVLNPIEEIDKSSFAVGQPQRLLGTYNLKYSQKPLAKDLKSFDKASFLSLETLERRIANEKKNKEELKRREGWNNTKTLKEAIKLIRKRVRVKDLANLGLLELKEMNGYWMTTCPFHNYEKTPSFSIKSYPHGDWGKDFHDGKRYDVIAIYQQITGKTFNEAIQDLAKIGGVDLTTVEVENLANDWDAESYVYELPIEKIERYIEDGVITFEITVENRDGLPSTFKATIGTLAKWERLKHLFLEYAGVDIPEIPKKGRDQALMQVIDILFERAEKSKYFVRNSDDDMLDVILEELAHGGLFGTFEQFYETPELLQGFKDDDNKYYTTLTILKGVAKKVGVEITQNKLKNIILKAGGEYIKYYGKGDKRKWVYRLPSSFQPIMEEEKEPEVW